MLQEFAARNDTDDDGNPAGGAAVGLGFSVTWQNGPLGRGDERVEPNGAFVETIIAVAAQRIEYYQESPFACDENAQALDYLNMALAELAARTARREAEGVEGTHEHDGGDTGPYGGLTRDELHDLLAERGLPVSGTKDERIERLVADDEAKAGAQ